MERISSFERVVGSIPESEKDDVLRARGERFNDQVFEDVRGKEREKTPDEIRIISLVNEETNKIRQKYGLEYFDIPPENIHVISEEKWPPDDKGDAFYTSMLQAVAIREQPAKIVFMKKMFHEMLHFKSYNALQLTSAEHPKLQEYRLGLTLHTRDGENMYFTNLNEAITEEMTKKFSRSLSCDPLFAQEMKNTEEVVARYSDAVTQSGEPLFNHDTFYGAVEHKKTWREAIGRLFGGKENLTNFNTERFSYVQERNMLHSLVGKIFERNLEQFINQEEVFEEFAKGMMTGNILPVGRLIERTFGKGTFRKIGELDKDIQAQTEFVDSL